MKKRPRADSGRRPQNDARDKRDQRPAGERSDNAPNVIYGLVPVVEALRSAGRRVERVLVADGARDHRLSEIFATANERNIPIEKVPRERIEGLTGIGATHQGVVAVASAAEYADADHLLDRSPGPQLFVVLDGVQDPRNLGAIMRTVECAGAGGIFIPERRAVGLTETVAKSSAGAIEYVKVAKVGNLNRFIESLKERNIWVVGASGEADMDHTEWDWTEPSALVLGAEGTGLHRLVAENCDALIRIPMHGKIDSLNVSVAAGVILFEAQRQRKLASERG